MVIDLALCAPLEYDLKNPGLFIQYILVFFLTYDYS